MPDNTIRLNKYLANAGVVSRRGIKELLKKGLILVNGIKVTEPGLRINPDKDKIRVSGEEIIKNANFVYKILNKPLHVYSTTADEQGRTTVVDLVKSPINLYPVGRLDADSIGLILLTNDGELTHKLTHPKYHIPKTYEVLIKGKITNSQLEKLKNGIILKDGKTLPAEAKILEEFKFTTKVEIVLHEGRNRQIRRMMGALRIEVLELKRVGIGNIKLNNLSEGKSRDLDQKEILELKASVS